MDWLFRSNSDYGTIVLFLSVPDIKVSSLSNVASWNGEYHTTDVPINGYGPVLVIITWTTNGTNNWGGGMYFVSRGPGGAFLSKEIGKVDTSNVTVRFSNNNGKLAISAGGGWHALCIYR